MALVFPSYIVAYSCFNGPDIKQSQTFFLSNILLHHHFVYNIYRDIYLVLKIVLQPKVLEASSIRRDNINHRNQINLTIKKIIMMMY